MFQREFHLVLECRPWLGLGADVRDWGSPALFNPQILPGPHNSLSLELSRSPKKTRGPAPSPHVQAPWELGGR